MPKPRDLCDRLAALATIAVSTKVPVSKYPGTLSTLSPWRRRIPCSEYPCVYSYVFLGQSILTMPRKALPNPVAWDTARDSAWDNAARIGCSPRPAIQVICDRIPREVLERTYNFVLPTPGPDDPAGTSAEQVGLPFAFTAAAECSRRALSGADRGRPETLSSTNAPLEQL